ncbi:restriction endonuclease subunit S, partial [Pseudomonas aeruginosa]
MLDSNDGGVWGDDPTGEGDTLVLRSTDQTVDGNWKLTDPAPRNLSAKERASALLIEGDLVVTKSSGSSLHIGKTTLVTADIAKQGCCYGNFMQRLRVNSSFTPKLAWYVMNNELARAQLDLLSNSTTGLANLNGTLIGEILLPVSTVAEQTQIARFLDHETARIDALIEEQQRLIELLKEKRQAVISHAVTKGLDPTAPMKDSGVEWLGEVPAHWVVAGLKRFWSVTDCKHITAEFVDEGIPLASIREVQSRYVDLDNAKQTTEVFYRQLIEGGRELVAGDLIFSRNATVGEVAQVANWHPPFAMGQDVCVLKKQYQWLSSDYLQAVLRSPVVTVQLDNLMIGSTFKRVNVEDIRGLVVPMPPEKEQKL